MIPNRSLLPLAALALAGPAAAQNNISWVTFHQDDTLLSGSSSTLLNDQQEKDYAWGDLDNDGWTDVVVVRKQPYTTAGRFPNVLLMNENGVLTDRTAQYASATDVPGTRASSPRPTTATSSSATWTWMGGSTSSPAPRSPPASRRASATRGST